MANIVYLVPTRALIQQVQLDIEKLLLSEGIFNASVVTLPLNSSITKEKANIFIFTQERLHILLGEHGTNVSFDLLIVDEAQKIGDGYRGILLQHAIESAIQNAKSCKIIFASPMTQNPDIFLEDAPKEVSVAPLVREDMMVSQNLIWVSQVSREPKKWNVELILESTPIKIGEILLPERPAPDSKRLPFVAFYLGNSRGGNVIYANGAADAEKIALQLYGLVGNVTELSLDQEIADLIDLIKKTIHAKYILGRMLRRGIAFHYGNMPLLIRTEIERLFNAGKIRYLVCTSTLIEGMNMPCQSIYIRGPQKGRGKIMTPSDFWNLAGRAGRWGKEFQGNVVCIDAREHNVWKDGAPIERNKYKVARTSDEVLQEGDKLLSFLDDQTPRDVAKKSPNLEYVFSYLVSSYIRHGSLKKTTWSRRFNTHLIQQLDDRLSVTVSSLVTPQEVILRNPGISPVAMDNLLSYFDDRTKNRKEKVEELIPPPPESADAVNEYSKILFRINKHLGDFFGRGKRVRQLALLIVDWLKGYPLARIIASREAFYRRSKETVKTAELIRNTMADVEEIARFQAPKYMACYVDLLRVYLEQLGRTDLTKSLLELNILLEFGVSQTTQLSLMGLGLSRSSAIAISEFITGDSLTQTECMSWLKENDWMTNDLPELIKREISNLLSIHG